MTMELYAIPYSPWSEKARWALDHHRADYAEVLYQPRLGERSLRKRTGKPGKVTVPVLFDGAEAFTDSLDIARHADAVGQGAPLFPPGREDEVVRWNAMADEALAHGRVRATIATRDTPGAWRASLPPPLHRLPAFLHGPIVRYATGYLLGKYPVEDATIPAAEARIRAACVALRGGLRGRDTLLDGFSFADIAMAQALQFVRPHASLPVGRSAQPCWTSEDLAAEFADLLAWRDALYARHRRPAG